VPPRRPMCNYAGGAAASGNIVSIQELLLLTLFRKFASSIASICDHPDSRLTRK